MAKTKTILILISIAAAIWGFGIGSGCGTRYVVKGEGSLKPGQQVVIQSTGPKPAWLTTTPASTSDKIYFVGFSSEGNSLEACDDRARAMANAQLSEMVGVFVNEEFGSELYTYGNTREDSTTGEVLQDAKALISENLIKGMAVEQRWNEEIEEGDPAGGIDYFFNCAVLSSLSKESYDFAVNMAYRDLQAKYKDITPQVKKHLDKLMEETKKDRDSFFKEHGSPQWPTDNLQPSPSTKQ